MRKAHPTEEPAIIREGVGPGDPGPCLICKKEMDEGRYWHMRHEHGIFEDYKQLNLADESGIL